MSAKEEKNFFRTVAPLPLDDVRAALYEVISGVWGSVREHRFSDFCNSVGNIQGLKWKQSEISLYGEAIRSRLDFLMGEGVLGAGMSSLGPLIYFFSDSVEDIRHRIVRRFPDDEVFIWSVPNHGRRILRA
jgi:beta-ribofuranosylaminobenzene 5'-phosphate synthase